MSRMELITRIEGPPTVELAPGVGVHVLASGSLGVVGLTTSLAVFRPGVKLPYHQHPFSEVIVVVSGGYGVFEPGASLPCHDHHYDESITIVRGRAICQVAGREYALADCATACIPRGRPHRFLNRSDRPLAMIWIYAGDEPERSLIEAGCCAGTVDLIELGSDPGDNN